jgi:hypothetical protein
MIKDEVSFVLKTNILTSLGKLRDIPYFIVSCGVQNFKKKTFEQKSLHK